MIVSDFRPMRKTLEDGVPAVFTPLGGRSSDGFLPFFNLAAVRENTENEGIVVALGWTGQWATSFTRSEDRIQVRAGLENARFKLLPHETLRMPSVLVMPWSGTERMVGQNRFRRLVPEAAAKNVLLSIAINIQHPDSFKS